MGRTLDKFQRNKVTWQTYKYLLGSFFCPTNGLSILVSEHWLGSILGNVQYLYANWLFINIVAYSCMTHVQRKECIYWSLPTRGKHSSHLIENKSSVEKRLQFGDWFPNSILNLNSTTYFFTFALNELFLSSKCTLDWEHIHVHNWV